MPHTSPTATQFLKCAGTVAERFNFHTPNTISCLHSEDAVELVGSATVHERKRDALSGLLAGGMSHYARNKLNVTDDPIFCYTEEVVPRTGEAALTLHVFHVDKSIAEALLIQTTSSIARSLGYAPRAIRINSLGDEDSVTRYTRDLTNFFRKRINDLPPEAREHLKDHAYSALEYLYSTSNELAFKSPNSLESLSDPSRKHFREIIEYLDMSETPYEIDPGLIGAPDVYNGTLFALDVPDDAPISIRGGRYDSFMSRRATRPIHAAGAVITLTGKKAPKRPVRRKAGSTPSVYVVQLGFGAKIRSLLLLDVLQNANIPVLQNLASDSLSAQLRDAERRNTRYALVLGQKEYLENTIMLRDLAGRTQEIVPLENIVTRLKRARLHQS